MIAAGLGLAAFVLWTPEDEPPESERPEARPEPPALKLSDDMPEDERRLRQHLHRGVAPVYDELESCGLGQASLQASVDSLKRLDRDLAKVGMRLDEGKIDVRRALMEVQAAHSNSRAFIEQALDREVPDGCEAAFAHPELVGPEAVPNVDWGKRPDFLGKPGKAAEPPNLDLE